MTYIRLHPPETRELRVRLSKQSTLDVLREYREQDPIALVFASGCAPGGGWRASAAGQEEDLCRQTKLGSLLESPAAERFYVENRLADAFGTDWCIYAAGVSVHHETWQASFVVCAAPNARLIGAVPDRESRLRQTLNRRAARIVDIARRHVHSVLILGAWGCGNHRNDPEHVIDAFAAALDSTLFEEVIFALPDPDMYERFRRLTAV